MDIIRSSVKTFQSARAIESFITAPLPVTLEPVTGSIGCYLEHRRGLYILRIQHSQSSNSAVVSLTIPGHQYATSLENISKRSQLIIKSAIDRI